MNPQNYPFVTVDILDRDGDALLDQLALDHPDYADEAKILKDALHVLEDLPNVHHAQQVFADWINSISGAQAPTS